MEEEAGKLCREFALTDTVMTVSYAGGAAAPSGGAGDRLSGSGRAEGSGIQ